jgi:hypothetical protein
VIVVHLNWPVTGNLIARILSWLDHFERDPASNRDLFLGNENEAETSFADLFHQPIMAQ